MRQGSIGLSCEPLINKGETNFGSGPHVYPQIEAAIIIVGAGTYLSNHRLAQNKAGLNTNESTSIHFLTAQTSKYSP